MTSPDPSPPSTAQDPATAELERKVAYYKERGEREVASARDVVTRHSGENILALVAAVEAVLKLHRPIVRRQGWPPTCSYDNHRWPCPEVEAITTALTGKEAGDE